MKTLTQHVMDRSSGVAWEYDSIKRKISFTFPDTEALDKAWLSFGIEVLKDAANHSPTQKVDPNFVLGLFRRIGVEVYG